MNLTYPATLTRPLHDAMLPTKKYVASLAHLYRLNGVAIPFRESDERAFVIDRQIRLVIEFGESWDVAAIAEYKELTRRANERLKGMP